MALAAGVRCGPYEITAKIGAGGMGEVYRARDTKLDRDVALKILPEAFASDPERLARFEREAKTLAALNHPHIAHIHGLEESGRRTRARAGVRGRTTLADRIAQGPIPIDEALTIARQIADALEAAHEQGIIHRDLKPANIKVRTDGTVKVLDFGLAKALDPTSAGTVDVTASPTITSPAMTGVGVILGTASYMSPEQARGQAINKRTDIWAFGCVLFEMIAGRRVFPGATISDTIAAVLERSPDWTALPPATPPPVRHVLARCLERDPKLRWRDIGNVRIELDDAEAWRPQTDSASPKNSRTGERAAWALLVALAAAVAAVVTPMLRKAPAPAEVRFNVLFPRGVTADFAQLAISPDGQQIVVAPSFGVQGPTPLWCDRWLRPRPAADRNRRRGLSVLVAGRPVDRVLRRSKVEAPGRQQPGHSDPRPCPHRARRRMAGRRHDSVRAERRRSVVSSSGDRRPGDSRHKAGIGRAIIERRSSFRTARTLSITPEGRRKSAGSTCLASMALNQSGCSTRRCRRLCTSGHLLFARQGELLAHAFDATRLALIGEAFRVADSVPSIRGSASHRSPRPQPDRLVRHGQHPPHAVRLVRSFRQAARNGWHA